jgi:hypothetical protein
LTVAVWLLGFMLWVPVEKLFMTEIGFDPATIGVMAAAYAALVPIIEVPSGDHRDRWSRRGVLVIAAMRSWAQGPLGVRQVSALGAVRSHGVADVNHAFRIVVYHDPTRTSNCSIASLRIASSLTLRLGRLPLGANSSVEG